MNMNEVRNITVQTLKEMQDRGDDFQLIDVREADEREISTIGGYHIPLAEIDKRVDEIQRGKAVILHCKSGRRSEMAIRFLQQEHQLDNLYNLHGGIMAYARDIDTSISMY
ncbi:MAG: rhodanese-like domain-containing protein [Saprospiraceae bacterium]|nr:rhodanese-like domain-containing protein [Saprospiraceae bacterium]